MSTTRELLAEANEAIHDLWTKIEELSEAADGERDCKYKSCPEEQAELKEQMKRTRWIDYAGGLGQGLTSVGVIWLLYQQWVIWKATAEATVEALQ